MKSKIKRCCGNCANAIDFAEHYFGGAPVKEPRLSEIRKRCCCGETISLKEHWKTDGEKCRKFKPKDGDPQCLT